MEVGVTRGFQGGCSNTLCYYAAHGIGSPPGPYEAVNLNALPCSCTNAPTPDVGGSHLFGVLNAHGTSLYFVGIDNIFYWNWSGHNPPSPDYGIGIETTSDGQNGTYVRTTPVWSPQWEDANFNFYNANNGLLQSALADATLVWCSYPPSSSFVDSLAPPGATC
jgi:hypothetical protein